MKKVLSWLAAPLLLAGLFVSCQPEQSELNLNDLPGTATIMGKVEYNPGVTKVGDAYITDYRLPAVGRTVCVKVMTSEFTGASEESEDFRTFTTTTNEKGLYSIQIPVGYHAIQAEVSVIPFVSEKTVEDNEHNIITLENAIYKTTVDKTVWLEDKSISEADLLMSSNKKQDVIYDQKVTLKGLVEAINLAKTENEDGEEEIEPTNVPFATDLIVRVYISGEEETNIKYNVKTDSKGSYSLEMMLPNNCWENTIRVTVEKEVSIHNFTHYYRVIDEETWQTQTVEVFYEGSVNMTLESRHKLVPAEMPALVLDPDPVNPELVKGIGNEIDEEEGLEKHNWLNWSL